MWFKQSHAVLSCLSVPLTGLSNICNSLGTSGSGNGFATDGGAHLEQRRDCRACCMSDSRASRCSQMCGLLPGGNNAACTAACNYAYQFQHHLQCYGMTIMSL
jgi:hypothetical protein